MEQLDRYDAIVIGSGATGGLAAKELTEKGMSVLLLEAGPAAKAPANSEGSEDRVADAILAEMASRQPIQAKCRAYDSKKRHLFVDDIDSPYTTSDGTSFSWIRGRNLGGRTLTWSGHTYRFSDEQFLAASRDGYGQDWPITYKDLAPFYDRVEALLRVCGSSESIDNLPDGAFIPPLPLNNGELSFQRAVQERWKDRRVIPARCAMHAGTASELSLLGERPKYSTSQSATLAFAGRTGRLTIRTNSVVTRILTNDVSASVDGVAFVDRLSREQSEIRSEFVLLCASTIESTRILLNGISSRNPMGTANSSGLLGCYLMDHTAMWYDGTIYYQHDAHTREQSNSGNGIYIPRFQNTHSKDSRFLRGFGIQGGAYDLPPHKARMTHSGAKLYASRVWFTVFGEMLGRRENRMTLDPEVRDAWGIPVPRFDVAHGPNELAMADAARQVMEEISKVAGIEWDNDAVPMADPGLAVHEVGTARMGTEADSSVVNQWNETWDVKNLFVLDGASFPSQGFQNPTLTMMAIAARACDYVWRKWKASS